MFTPLGNCVPSCRMVGPLTLARRIWGVCPPQHGCSHLHETSPPPGTNLFQKCHFSNFMFTNSGLTSEKLTSGWRGSSKPWEGQVTGVLKSKPSVTKRLECGLSGYRLALGCGEGSATSMMMVPANSVPWKHEGRNMVLSSWEQFVLGECSSTCPPGSPV